ncbi:MAG: hypothetical protein RBT37_08185 [Dissulfurispiraceae bacterium]|jgi:hypothetical protein|nr:hypothetical protein [Dissulfurispiraceae bacterium]
MYRGIDWINVDHRKWEEIQSFYFRDHDLIIACNSLHLLKPGFEQSLAKVFRTGAKNIFVINEPIPDVSIPWAYCDYTMFFTKSYEEDCSFAYHHLDEVLEHHAYKKGVPLSEREALDIKARLSFEDDHFCIKDKAVVSMYWWQRNPESKTWG